MGKILIVEDDPNINKMEQTLLTKHNYEVVTAFSGTEALLLLEREEVDLILLDLMLPGKDGESVLSEVVKQYKKPVICVSAKDALTTRVEMLHKGADDFLVKPFHNEELLVRIEALLRRTNAEVNGREEETDELVFQDIVLDVQNHTVAVGHQELTLTAKEFQILELLMQNPKKVFSKANIYESIWPDEVFIDDSAVTVHVSNLRNKLSGDKDKYIKTVWGIGYKMQDHL